MSDYEPPQPIIFPPIFNSVNWPPFEDQVVGGGGGGVAGSVVNDGLWHFIVATFDGSVVRLYKDNVLVGSQGNTLNTINTTLKFQAFQLDGDLDEVGYWNRVLTPTELTDLYNSGNGITYPFTPPITDSPSFLLNFI